MLYMCLVRACVRRAKGLFMVVCLNLFTFINSRPKLVFVLLCACKMQILIKLTKSFKMSQKCLDVTRRTPTVKNTRRISTCFVLYFDGYTADNEDGKWVRQLQ